ncbi:MAG TPA: DNA primase [Planctomycetota bacterium]|jgi:DNA primase|nr:DNA primase [Planctomycetota bacterium]
MSQDLEFKRAIDEVKLRSAIEEVVREYVPDLKKAGRLWEACCPFHDEKTPSFKVDPAKQMWRCYGACSEGGDVLSFVQKSQNLGFTDALELLASQAGVEIPKSRGRRAERSEDDPGMVALARADAFFQHKLQGNEGRLAREYLASRGMGENTIKAFGLGWAPGNRQELVRLARQEAERGQAGDPCEAWVRAGVLRRGDDGGEYSFFRERLVIPIRDLKGRTIGFGARRLSDNEKAGPKYINSSESDYFHKGRVIYALDRAIDHVRKGRHLVLVEGYTDVMAAHQVGLNTVCAVLGTSTTEMHAGLVRKSGARRVTLVFDGDDAGRKAAWRALDGLLPLDVDLEVAVLPNGKDPADLCREGSEAFTAQLDHAQDWFDFLTEGVGELKGKEQAHAVDDILRLLERLTKPVHRSSLHAQLAERLTMPLSTILEARNHIRRGVREPGYTLPPPNTIPAGGPDGDGRSASGGKVSEKKVDKREVDAYKAAVGSVLMDSALVPRIRSLVDSCPNVGLKAVMGAILALYEDEDKLIDESSVMTQLGADPVRNHVSTLVTYASQTGLPPHELLEASLQTLDQLARRKELSELKARSSDPDLPEEARQELVIQITHKTRELQSGSVPSHLS